MNTESDEIVYIRYLEKRNEDDLRTLLVRYRERLTFFVYGYVHNMEDAEDIMLDTFATIAAKDHWSAKGSSFKTWLFSISHKIAVSKLRKNKFLLQEMDENFVDPAKLPELEILENERNRELYTAISKLKPEYRQILTLLYFEDMKCEEAAAVMKKNIKQIYHLAERSKESLKKILEKSGFDYAEY